jgi:adenine-specific DNA-methyltransferase
VIKYIGSKRTLLPELVALLRSFPELTSAADLFSGTSRVGHAFKRAGLRVISNDHNAYAFTLAQCYVEADLERVERDASGLIAELNRVQGSPGWFTETFCIGSRFFQPKNGARIDAIREAIERKGLDPVLRSVILTALMEAADRVDSTCGLQMAYVKAWAPRSFNDLELRMPEVLPAVEAGPCRAMKLDANVAARQLEVDITYLDPPYNQHSYLSNYHIWESLVLWDKPDVYGVACKRVDCRTRKSDYNSKRAHRSAFVDLVDSLTAPLIVVSFNNEGYQSRAELEQVLARHGELFVVTKDFKRYVGAQIGIYNPAGDKVGKISHLRNKEHIYLVATPALFRRVSDARTRLLHLAHTIGDEARQTALPSG